LRDNHSRRRTSRKSKRKCTSLRAGSAERAQAHAKPEALALYKKTNQIFKCELVEEKASEPMVSFYTTGKFIDFCRGPHIPSTKRIQAFKLMSVAGAYWKGQEGNPQLQRIYAIAFSPRKNSTNTCTAWRKPSAAITASLARNSTLQHPGRSRPGLIFWHPKGGSFERLSRTGSAKSC